MSCYPILYFQRRTVAVILCGGKSTRMGTDKGLLDTGNGIWVKNMERSCHENGLEIFISINTSQKDAYAQLYKPQQLIYDTLNDIGPVNGLISTLNVLPDCDIIFLSCDMQHIDGGLLHEFLKNYEMLGEYDLIINKYDGFYQPFPGLYSFEFLQKLASLHLSNAISKYSFQEIFKLFNVFELSLDSDNQSKIRSLNSSKDL